MTEDKTQELAKQLLSQVLELVNQTIAAQGVSLSDEDKQPYYRASRQVLRAVVAAASQRMFEDGANPALVGNTLRARDGWELFLSAHPDIAAKVAAEKEAKQKMLAMLLGPSVAGLDDDEDEGSDHVDASDDDTTLN